MYNTIPEQRSLTRREEQNGAPNGDQKIFLSLQMLQVKNHCPTVQPPVRKRTLDIQLIDVEMALNYAAKEDMELTVKTHEESTPRACRCCQQRFKLQGQ